MLGANGSLRLPGGLIAQWGHVTAADADVAVPFGIAFPGAASASGRSQSPTPATRSTPRRSAT
ncbi:gp53-like domain-containing protein [Methylobacterium oryzae CBMB20]